MKSIAKHCWAFGLVLIAAPGLAHDQIPWVADFQTACGMAAEQRRLVMLHFYNDNCGPCVRLEQNVFSRPEVGEAVAQNFLAVKVHAGKNPQLATRYRINQWPTDVFVTPSGLEVHRAISEQNPAKYIAVLNQVAQQAGVGAGRQWANQVGQSKPPAANPVSATANTFAATAQQATQQVTGAVQDPVNQFQQGWGGAVSQFQQAADQARDKAQQATQQATTAVQQSTQQVAAATQQTQQHATGAVQQSTDAAKNWSQQATDAVQQYEQQAGESYRQFRDQSAQKGELIQQQAQATKQEWKSTTQTVATEYADTSKRLMSQWQQGNQSLLDRRSAFVPLETSPAAESVAAAQAAPPAAALAQAPTSQAPTSQPPTSQPPASQTTPPVSPPPSATTQPMPPEVAPVIAQSQAPQLTQNPWVAGKPSEPASPAAANTAPPVAAPPVAANLPLVPASQAPPLTLDGFCPVTLLETMAKNPNDRAAWKKGDKRFGAIHRGRTYLFASAEHQQKFLTNPDAYAPVLAGFDPVRYAERGELVDGKRAYGIVTPDRQIYLFADETTRNRFEQSPAMYANVIQQAMLKAESGNVYR